MPTVHDKPRVILAQLRYATAALHAAQEMPDGPAKVSAILHAVANRDDLRAICRAKNIKIGK